MQPPAFAKAGRDELRACKSARPLSLVRTLLLLACMLAAAVHAPQVQAEAATGTQAAFLEQLRSDAEALIRAGEAGAALELVGAHESTYVGNPDFDYLLGTAALAAGRNTVAVHALERVVLVQPSHAGAYLDLAIAHYRLGEFDAADGILKHIEEHFDPPLALRNDIAGVRARIARARITQGWQLELGAFTGHTNNANYGLAVSTLPLTLDGLPVSLLLDPAFRPRSDGFAELRGSALRSFDLGSGERADVYAALRARNHGSESAQDQRDLVASGVWRRPVAWRDFEGASVFAGALLRNLSFDSRSLRIAQFSGGLRASAGRCQLSARADYEHRLYGSAGLPDAAIPWLGASADCAQGALQYGAQQRMGYDFALGDRAGGDTLRAETQAYLRWQAAPQLQLGALLFYAHAADAEPYSPILAEGARRRIDRFGQKLEATWVPGANPKSPWAFVIEIENISDRSNIGLSSVDVTQFQIGLIYRKF